MPVRPRYIRRKRSAIKSKPRRKTYARRSASAAVKSSVSRVPRRRSVFYNRSPSAKVIATMAAVQPPISRQNTYPGHINSATNFCTIAGITINEASDITALMVSLNNQLPAVGANNVAMYSAGQTTRMNLYSSYMDVHYANRTNADIHVRVHELTCIRDVPKLIGATPGLEYLIEGEIFNSEVNTESLSTSSDINSTLNDNKILQEYFKITSTESMFMRAGADIKKTYLKGGFHSIQRAAASGDTYVALNGVTKILVFQINGPIAADSLDPTLVGYAPGRLDYVVTEFQHYGLGSPPFQTQATYSLGNIAQAVVWNDDGALPQVAMSN